VLQRRSRASCPLQALHTPRQLLQDVWSNALIVQVLTQLWQVSKGRSSRASMVQACAGQI
jgi:hypothetical protein